MYLYKNLPDWFFTKKVFLLFDTNAKFFKDNLEPYFCSEILEKAILLEWNKWVFQSEKINFSPFVKTKEAEIVKIWTFL